MAVLFQCMTKFTTNKKKKKKEEVYGILTLFHILTKMIMKVCLFCKNFFSCTPRDLYTFLYVFKLNRVPFKIIF